MADNDSFIQVGNRRYQVGATLGVGGFSEVKKGVDVGTRRRVALKITYTDQRQSARELQTQLRSVQKEIKSMKILNHPNIVRLLGYDLKCTVEDRSAIVMVQELAPKGELFDYLMHTKFFPQNMAISVFKQLVDGLTAIHGAGIAHRDLKPENLLFDNDYNLKIADFGFSYVFKKGDGPNTQMRTELGTKGYMAPEILNGSKYDEKADIFAAGVILFICLAGFPPFQNAVSSDWWFDKLRKKKHRLFWMAHERTATFSPEAKDIIQGMLEPTVSDRLDVNGIKQTSFYNSNCLNTEELQAELASRKETVDRNKRNERANSPTTREVFAEALKAKMGQVGDNDILPLGPLIETPVRKALEDYSQPEDLNAIFQMFSDPKRGGLIRLRHLSQYLPENADPAVVVDQLQQCATTEEIQAIFSEGMDELKAADVFKIMNTNAELGFIEDYDPEYLQSFLELDSVALPEFSAEHYTIRSYRTPIQFGILCYALNKFVSAYQGGDNFQLEIYADETKCILSADLQKKFLIPEELVNEHGQNVNQYGELLPEDAEAEVQWIEAALDHELIVDIRMFTDPLNGQSIVTFTSKGDVNTMEMFQEIEQQLTTNRQWLIAECIHKQCNHEAHAEEAVHGGEEFVADNFDHMVNMPDEDEDELCAFHASLS